MNSYIFFTGTIFPKTCLTNSRLQPCALKLCIQLSKDAFDKDYSI